MQEKLDKFLAKGVIERTSFANPNNHPLVITKKKDSTGRLTDIRVAYGCTKLNDVLKDEAGNFPVIEHLLSKVSKRKYFSLIDLAGAFHQFSIREEDRHKLAFTFNRVRYQWKRAAFGLMPMCCERLMEALLEGLEEDTGIFLDDLCLMSDTIRDHIILVRAVLCRLTKAHLRINVSKSHFLCIRIALLGFVVDSETLGISPLKIEELDLFDRPRTPKEVKSLLGFTGFLAKFVPHYSTVTKPLTVLANSSRADFAWTDEHEEAFHILKLIISNPPVLNHFIPGAETYVACDASKVGIGVALLQVINGRKRFNQFVSKTLTKTQRTRYSANKKELLAILFALTRLRHYLLGHSFTILTDHQSLCYMFNNPHLPDVLKGWLGTISQYKFKVKYIPGFLNLLPDRLSRLYFHLPHFATAKDHRYLELRSPAVCIAEADALLESLKEAQSDHSLSISRIELDSIKLTAKDLNRFARDIGAKVVPDVAERARLLEENHQLGHNGAKKLVDLIWDQGHYWPNLYRDAARLCGSCPTCLSFNVRQQGFRPLRHICADRPLDHISLDLAHMTPSFDGHVAFVVIRDVATRYIFAWPLTAKTSAATADALYLYTSIFGPARRAQSDGGPEFVGSVYQRLAERLGIKTIVVSAEYPQSNGGAEATIRRLKQYIVKINHGRPTNSWHLALPAAVMAINRQTNRTTKSTPASLMFAYPQNPLLGTVVTDEEKAGADTPSLVDEIRSRHQAMLTLVYPAVRCVVDAENRKTKAYVDRKRLQKNPLPPGAIVKLRNQEENRPATTPLYSVEDYTVAARNRQGSYRLYTDSDGIRQLLPRSYPLSHLLLVALPASRIAAYQATKQGQKDLRNAADAAAGPTFDVELILDHRRGPKGGDEFLVKWTGYSAAHNSWEPLANFNDRSLIRKYFVRREAAGPA